jgi:hypothetical protein
MSGGSYDYAYCKIQDMADSLRCTTPARKAFKTLLNKVAKACHDIEWVDSGDCSPGDEDKAIRIALGDNGPALILAEAVAEAKRVQSELQSAIQEASHARR